MGHSSQASHPSGYTWGFIGRVWFTQSEWALQQTLWDVCVPVPIWNTPVYSRSQHSISTSFSDSENAAYWFMLSPTDISRAVSMTYPQPAYLLVLSRKWILFFQRENQLLGFSGAASNFARVSLVDQADLDPGNVSIWDFPSTKFTDLCTTPGGKRDGKP